MLPYPLRLAKERHGDTSVVLGTVSIDVRAFNSTHACAASRALHRSFEVPSELYAALRHKCAAGGMVPHAVSLVSRKCHYMA
jgi:hypothetical protein